MIAGARETHEHCDLVIGRYSSPLVKVICPAGAQHSGGSHPLAAREIDADWLALLVVASTDTIVESGRLVFGVCWTARRARALRRELQLDTLKEALLTVKAVDVKLIS